jgi:hypothetical protein
MNNQLKIKKAITIFIIIVVALFILSLVNRGNPGEFELKSSRPANRSRAVNFELDAIRFTFNQDVNPDFRVSSVVITPELEADVKVESDTILILPRYDLKQDTLYKVQLASVASVDGQTLNGVETSFRTMLDESYRGRLSRTAPKYFDGFSITYIESMDAYVIAISELPIEENEAKARSIMEQNGITDNNSKIIVDLSRDLMNSGAPPEPKRPAPVKFFER